MNGAAQGLSWGNSTTVRVTMSSKGWAYCFNLVIECNGRKRVYENIRDDGSRWKRFVHWIATPFRKADRP